MDNRIKQDLHMFYDSTYEHDLEQRLSADGFRITENIVSTDLRDFYNDGLFSGRTVEDVYSQELGIDCSQYNR